MDLYDGDQTDFKTSLPTSAEVNYIGIGYSLGLMKLLSLPLKFKALIGLQSFINFLGFDPILAAKRRCTLNTMCENFRTNPQLTLNQFYKTCAGNANAFEKQKIHLISPNFQKLNQDLTMLYTSCSLPLDIPLLILGTARDKIVPPELIYDNFAKVKNVQIHFYDTGGHILGYQHPDIVSKKILDFIHEFV